MKRSRYVLLLVVISLLFTQYLHAATVDYFIYDDWGGTWADAEKSTSSTEDDNMCWAAATSNILQWTGWYGHDGSRELVNADDIFGYYQDHWTNDGGKMEYAWNWWFDGTYDGPPTWSYPDVEHDGFYNQVNFYEYFTKAWDPEGSMSIIDQYLHDGYGTALGLYNSGLGHAVSIWGFEYDPESADYYKGIYITDSDDDMGGLAPRPDSLKYYDVVFADNKWSLQNYSGSDSWYIGDIQGLALNPGFLHNPEPATLFLFSFGSLVLLKKNRKK